MKQINKFININIFMSLVGLLYYNLYITQPILIPYLYCIFYNVFLVTIIDYTTKDNVRISKKLKHTPTTINILFNISIVGGIEMISIFICNKRISNDIIYELITFIPKSFIFEINFDFFHYWTHRLAHHKYLYYYFHKTHHKYTSNISVFSTYNHSLIDLLMTNVLPMYVTSFIHPLSEPHFFIFLIFKTFIEISGHAGKHIKNSSFTQCFWIPRLFGIELYSRDHYIHHEKFKYNYGKRFTLWDKAFGTYKTDDKIIKREKILFDKKSIVIKNEYIKYSLFLLLLGICYLV
jgi:sterol desaturase/sphingolipid hydroxylase (fatty acid hydroxylase superfamily)